MLTNRMGAVIVITMLRIADRAFIQVSRFVVVVAAVASRVKGAAVGVGVQI